MTTGATTKLDPTMVGMNQTGLAKPEQLDAYRDLTPQEIETARARASALQLNAGAVLNFGSPSMNEMSKVVDQIIDVSSRDTGEIGPMLDELLDATQKTNISSLGKSAGVASIPVVGPLIIKVFNPVKSFLRSFESNREKVEKLTNQVRLRTAQGTHDIASTEQLFMDNAQVYKQLCMDIVTGQEALAAKRQELDELKQLESQGQGGAGIQVQQLQNQVSMLERRVYNLQSAAFDTYLTAAQIMMTRDFGVSILEKLVDTTERIIPAWKRKVAMHILQLRQMDALKIIKQINDANNRLARENADRLYQIAIETEQALQRGDLDLETMVYVSDATEKTIKEVRTMREQARQQRESGVQEMQQLRKRLDTTMSS